AGQAQPCTDLIEVDVARMLDRFDEVEGAMTLSFPAAKDAPSECVASAARLETRGRGRYARAQRGQHGDDLEGRAGRIGALDRPVEQRVGSTLGELVPAIDRQATSELVGIERGAADHRQDPAVTRIDGHG